MRILGAAFATLFLTVSVQAQVFPGASWIETYFCNQEFDQLLDDARKELDLAKRTELYQKAQQLLVDESGTIIPFFKNVIEVMDARVKGIPIIEYDNIPWHKIYIEEQ